MFITAVSVIFFHQVTMAWEQDFKRYSFSKSRYLFVLKAFQSKAMNKVIIIAVSRLLYFFIFFLKKIVSRGKNPLVHLLAS